MVAFWPARHLNDIVSQQKIDGLPAVSRQFWTRNYHGVGNLHLINSKKIQIGIGIGKFSVINSEELQIGKNLALDPPPKGIGIGIGQRN